MLYDMHKSSFLDMVKGLLACFSKVFEVFPRFSSTSDHIIYFANLAPQPLGRPAASVKRARGHARGSFYGLRLHLRKAAPREGISTYPERA